MSGKLGYLAGIVDGEGCISIRKWRDKKKYWGYSLMLDIGNTNHKLSDWLLENYGGSVLVFRSSNIKHNDRYTWRVSHQQAGSIIKAILPFLILKREQAILALKFRETYKRGNTAGLPEEIINKRESLIEQMHALNKRGLSSKVS